MLAKRYQVFFVNTLAFLLSNLSVVSASACLMPGYTDEYGEKAYLEDLGFAVTIVKDQIPRLSLAEENWLHTELSADNFKRNLNATASNIYVRNRTIRTLGALNIYISQVLERLQEGLPLRRKFSRT